MHKLPVGYQPHSCEPYMNLRQQDFFRSRLLLWRQRLLAESRQSQQRILENERPGGDLLDQSVNDTNRTMDFLHSSRLKQTIRQIDAALERLQDGTYGYCLETEEEIGLARLLAYPIATLSVEIQELREHRQRSLHSQMPS